MTFFANNPVAREIGNNITMQWSVNRANEDKYVAIVAHFLPEPEMEKQIVTSIDGKPTVTHKGKGTFEDRLMVNLTDDDNLTLTIINVKYQDQGNYSVNVFLNKGVPGKDTVALHVFGMFFSVICSN